MMKINAIENRLIQALFTIAALCVPGSNALLAQTRSENQSPPNILFCISDDQSYAHTGANGDPRVTGGPILSDF